MRNFKFGIRNAEFGIIFVPKIYSENRISVGDKFAEFCAERTQILQGRASVPCRKGFGKRTFYSEFSFDPITDTIWSMHIIKLWFISNIMCSNGTGNPSPTELRRFR